MTQHQYIKSLEQEISQLNRRIDQNILQGKSYGAIAQRHKSLLSTLRKLSKERTSLFAFSF
jgi:hypothetical protein